MKYLNFYYSICRHLYFKGFRFKIPNFKKIYFLLTLDKTNIVKFILFNFLIIQN